jgi:hypothetical protein
MSRPESKAAFVKSLDELIGQLSRLREELASSAFDEKTAEIRKPLEQVIGFLQSAKSDERLRTFLFPISKPQRQPVEIPSNLTNEQIRVLLEKNLSNSELKAIAEQRAISVDKSSNAEIKRSILKNLERQENYSRLSSQ